MADITGTYPSSGELQGVISTASFIAGEVVGMRGPKGDKGDKGDPGNDGADGQDGVSPSVTITEITGGNRVTITDADHPLGQTFDVMDGEDGQDGAAGQDGADGTSIASIVKTGTSGLVDTYTITLTDGTTYTFTVTNGQNGSGSVVDVWQNGVSVLDGTIAKVTVPTKTSDLTNDAGFITGYTETDPTVANWAKQANKPSYTASEVGALPDTTSIPSKTSDLTNDSGYITGIPYGECSTAGETAAKEVTVTPNITLTAGTMIAVKFANANSVASSTLNVNSLGAKPIVRYGTTGISTSAATSWNAGSIVLLTYDGTSWAIDNFNNTTYTSMTVAEYQNGTGTTAKTITPARLKGAIEYHSANKTSTSVTISVADWNATTTCTKSVTGVTSSNDVIVTPAPTSLADWSGGGLYCSAQGSGTLTFTCSSTPTASIDVNVLIIN